MEFNHSAFETLCARDYFDHSENQWSHNLPIYATSTFDYKSPQAAMDFFEGKSDEHMHIYSRWYNPTVLALEAKLAAMETFDLEIKAKAICFASGMGAISAALLACLKSGDTLLTQPNLYGTTTELIQTLLIENNINHIYIDFNNVQEVEELLAKDQSIKAIYLESPNNPTMQCVDVAGICDLAKEYVITTLLDNTFNSPMVMQPFALGVDLVLYSSTKFYNGHSTALGGAVIGRNIEFMEKQIWKMRKMIGATLSPFDAWLTYMGIKTLPLRMRKHQENALVVATMLNSHRKVDQVNFVGLSSHPQYALAKQQMYSFGSMLSFTIKDGLEPAKRFMSTVNGMSLTASLGSTSTLIAHPASMTHVQVPIEQREAAGITDGLIRIAIGIEGIDDLLTELNSALEKA